MAGGVVLSVERREKTGTGPARAVRRADQVPGVLYGGARGAVPIALKRNELTKALRSGKFVSHMIEIDHQGERQPVIPRAIQYHPVTDEPIHVDLYRVEEGAVITVQVPIHVKNGEISPGLKRGGVLNLVHHTIELACPANAIPEEIVVDIGGLDIGAVLHLEDLNLPAGVTPVVKEKGYTVLTLAGRGGKDEDAAAPAAAAEGEAKKD